MQSWELADHGVRLESWPLGLRIKRRSCFVHHLPTSSLARDGLKGLAPSGGS